jgi:hypothetical protein
VMLLLVCSAKALAMLEAKFGEALAENTRR